MRDKSLIITNLTDLKDTELGLLPMDWSVVEVKDVFEFTIKPRNLNLPENQEIPFIPMQLIPEEGKNASWELKKVSNINSGTFIFKNDLIIGKITPCFENGKQAILDNLPNDFGYATTEIWALHPKNNRVINEHLFHYIRIQSIRRDLASKMEGTTGRQRLPKHVIFNFKLPLPPLSEQKEIANILSAIQNAKEKINNSIKAIRDLKKSLMNHLFKFGLVSLEDAEKVNLKSNEMGEFPEEWGLVPLDTLVDVKGGKRLPKGHSFSKEITNNPYLRVVDFSNGAVNFLV